MKIIHVDPSRPELMKINETAEIILSNGIIGYPTETVYGLGANALSDAAVEKVFELKGREKNKPILIIASELDQVKKLVVSFSHQAEILAKAFWPGALTMVFEAAPQLSKLLLGGGNHIGIRIPASQICLELLKLCGVPITSTSANLSGRENPITAQEVLDYFGKKLDLIIDGGRLPSRVASTVIAIENEKLKLLREGAIPFAKIQHVIGKFKDER
jgi:L-threonylcarbamoyladenylate synthase